MRRNNEWEYKHALIQDIEDNSNSEGEYEKQR